MVVDDFTFEDEPPSATFKEIDMWLQKDPFDQFFLEGTSVALNTSLDLEEEQRMYESFEDGTSFVDLDKSTSLIEHHRSTSLIDHHRSTCLIDHHRLNVPERCSPELTPSLDCSSDSFGQNLVTPEAPNHVDELFPFALPLGDELPLSLLDDVQMVPTSAEPAPAASFKSTFSEISPFPHQEQYPIFRELAVTGTEAKEPIEGAKDGKTLRIKRKGKTNVKRISRTSCSGKKTGSKRKCGPKIYEFIIDHLQNKNHSHIMSWLDLKGKFKIVAPNKFAELWAKRNGKMKDVSYNNVARAMRYWYKTDYLEPVLRIHHIYRMGPKSMQYINDNYGGILLPDQCEQLNQCDQLQQCDQPYNFHQPDQWDPPNKFGDRDGDWRPCTEA